MRFYLDGKEIKIPKRLYADCFDPNLGNDYVTLEFGDELRSVVITISGSDGAGGYQAVWRLKKDGQHRRSIVRGVEVHRARPNNDMHLTPCQTVLSYLSFDLRGDPVPRHC